MWLNSMQREEPYLDLTSPAMPCESRAEVTRVTGAAWLSSVRAVRCLVKSTNERNPCRMLPTGQAGNSSETAGSRQRKVGMTSSQYGPYIQGCTRATMAHTEGRETARWSQPQRVRLSSDRGLQPDPVKSDLLVTAYQLRRRECVPGPCTHRPSHHESRLHPKSGICPPKVWVVIGMKS